MPSPHTRSGPADARRVVVIGGGNMARAIIAGGAGMDPPPAWRVVEPDVEKRHDLEKHGVPIAAGSLGELVERIPGELDKGSHAIVLLAVKPQMLPVVSREWAQAGITFDGVVISILAGTPTEKVRAALGGGPGVPGVRVVRAMPNLAAAVGHSATAICLGAGAGAGDDAFALQLFHGIGPVVERVDESLMDAVTALSGSGPAYVFYLAQAMIQGGVEAGLSHEVADRLVRQTLVGASESLSQASGRSPEALRAAVTSKGGTTEAAIALLEAAKVGRLLADAVIRGRDRGREIGSS